MKKILLASGLALIASTQAFATDTDSKDDRTYMGIEFGGGSYDTKLTGPNASGAGDLESDLDDAGNITLLVGKYLNDDVRAYAYLKGDSLEVTYGAFGFSVIKYERSTYSLGAGADYLFPITDNFYALAGGNIGLYNSEFTVSQFGGPSQTKDNTGVELGVNAGLGYAFTKNFSLETGLRLNQQFGNEFTFGSDKVTYGMSTSYYLGAQYTF